MRGIGLKRDDSPAMMFSRSTSCLVLTASLGGSFTALAEVKLHSLFGDHMVLQRDRPLPVWGRADAGEKVAVVFNGMTQNTTAGADGRWKVIFPPQAVSTEPRTLIARGSNEVTIRDVLVGDVWLGSGQSNMDYVVNGTDGKERIQNTPPEKFEGIRLFKVPQVEADAPQADLAGQWEEAKIPNVMAFSATLFYFGETVHERQPGVPLGLIRSSVGATNAYSWIPNEVRDESPGTAYLREWWGNATRSWTPEKQTQRDQETAAYEAQVADYKARKEKLPDTLKKPGELIGPKWSRRPSALYNGMIAPLQPFALRGMIWYQGEWDSKSDWVKVYQDTFSALARSWRKAWADQSGSPALGEFPIYLVQLPSRETGDGNFWPYMREVQERLSQTIPNSAFVTTYDTNPGGTDLHPKEKSEIGRRLARVALAKEYQMKIAWRGPSLKSFRTQGNYLLLEFDAGSEELKNSDGQPLRGFEIAGMDGQYVPATAEMRLRSVRLSAPSVTKPMAARYAFTPAPEKPNFVNSEGLPASPFRTDSLPVPGK